MINAGDNKGQRVGVYVPAAVRLSRVYPQPAVSAESWSAKGKLRYSVVPIVCGTGEKVDAALSEHDYPCSLVYWWARIRRLSEEHAN